MTNETLYDSVVLTKDTGVIRDLLIDGNKIKTEKNKLKVDEVELIIDRSLNFAYRPTLTGHLQKLVYRPTLTGRPSPVISGRHDMSDTCHNLGFGWSCTAMVQVPLIKVYEYTSMLVIFTRGNNFHDFLFASLADRAIKT